MKHTYADIVEILRISQDQPARAERFNVFKRAVSFYVFQRSIQFPKTGVFLVAGTNGKGTTSKTLETLLAASGANVGLFTSPHLIEPTERIRSGQRDLTPDEMVAAYTAIKEVARDFELSHFEILTLMMIEVFFGGTIRPRVDFAVIEVGVGGRLDPTRVVPHDVSVMAQIGLDHEAILGSSVGAIAREKLAIIDHSRVFVYLPPLDSSVGLAIDDAKALHPGCVFVQAKIYPSRLEHDGVVPRWILKTPHGEVALNLMGERAVQNTSLALEVLRAAGLDLSAHIQSLSSLEWHGRMERIAIPQRLFLNLTPLSSVNTKPSELFLSGDHNEQGVESLREILAHFRYETLQLVVGIGKGKPIDKMLAIYKSFPRAQIILTSTNFRSLSLGELQSHHDDVEPNALKALERAIARASANDLIVVSGSLYLVGDLASSLRGRLLNETDHV